MVNIKRKKPDKNSLHKLLNDGFEGWGQKDYFEWKYDLFPGYDPERDNFLVYSDSGELIGARRVFEKVLYSPSGEKIPVHVHGGTVVHKDHRGHGHYSELLSKTNDFSDEEAEFVFTFNREGMITTKHHKKNDWSWISLPIHVKIISPAKILSNEFLSNKITEFGSDLVYPLEKRLTKYDAVSRSINRIASFKYGNIPPSSENLDSDTGNVIVKENISDSLAEEIYEFLSDSNIENFYRFQRNPSIIKHCSKYPKSRTYIERDFSDGKIRGYGISGILEKNGLKECRILEQRWSDKKVGKNILDKIEDDVRKFGVDVISICSRDFPSDPTWLKMEVEYMMWKNNGNKEELSEVPEEWRVTIYDIL